MQGPLFIFIAAILWGLDGILRRTLFTIPAATIVFYEHLIGFLLILPFLISLLKTEKISKKEWGSLAVIALFSGVLGTIFFTMALQAIQFIPFSVVFLVQKLQPIFAIAMAALVLREYPEKSYWFWAGLALVAGYFVTFPMGVVNFGEGGGYVTAALYAFLAAVLWGSSTSFSRFTLLNHSHTLITGLRFALTVPFALLFVFALDAAPTLAAVSWQQFGLLALIALSTGMAALWIYYKGLKTTPVRVTAIVELAFPVTAVFVDYFLYSTVLTIPQYIAAAILLFAAYKVAKLIPGATPRVV